MSKQHADREPESLLAILRCPGCADDVPHRVTYRSNTVVETVCTRCNRALIASRRQRSAFVNPSRQTSSLTLLGAAARRGALPMLPTFPRKVGRMAVNLPVRVLTKPGRLWKEMHRNGAGVLLSIPRRAATKPVRLVAELTGLGRSGR